MVWYLSQLYLHVKLGQQLFWPQHGCAISGCRLQHWLKRVKFHIGSPVVQTDRLMSPSPCTASFQALSVNAFRWRIREKRTTWPEMHRPCIIMRPRDYARVDAQMDGQTDVNRHVTTKMSQMDREQNFPSCRAQMWRLIWVNRINSVFFHCPVVLFYNLF